VLPVCNDRPAVHLLLSKLRRQPDAATGMRLVRMRGRHGLDRANLMASAQWQQCRATVENSMAAPALRLDSGGEA